MIKNLYVTEGAAGTGKTYEINREIEKSLKEDKIIHYSCHNVKVKNKARKSLPYSKNSTINNIHAFCYGVHFKLINIDELDDFDSDENQLDYKKLLKDFLKIPSPELRSILPAYTDIFIDEAQDFTKLYFKVIKHICNTFDVNLHISGDRFQQINKDYRSKKEPFNIFYNLDHFGIKPILKYLNYNYRTSNSALLQFFNGFISKNYPDIPEELIYSNTIEDVKNKYALPEICWCKDKYAEYNYVHKLINNIPECKTYIILSRYKRDLIIYNDQFNTSTINSFKGDEADYIFIVGFQDYDKSDYIEKNILLNAFTRTKEKIYISSAFPKFDLNTIFQSGTYNEKGKQTQIVKSFNKLKTIKVNKNFSKEKLLNNFLDTLIIQVKFKDAPFHPYVKNEFIQSQKVINNQWENRQSLVKDHIPYKLRYHKVHKCYSFEFRDLNLLKKNRYTDVNSLQFMINIISDFFDHRISLDKMNCRRVDLCKIYNFKDLSDKIIFKNKLAFNILKGKKYSIKNHLDEKLSTDVEIINNFDKSTVYANCLKSGNYTLACYDPKNKKNYNKINSNDNFKIELRLEKECLECNYAEPISTMDKLLETVKEGRLEETLKNLLERQNISLL